MSTKLVEESEIGCCTTVDDTILNEIAAELRKKVPRSGVLPSEHIYEPDNLTKETQDATLHVDEFLFNDAVLDELVEEGVMSRHYCTDCGSRKVKPLTLISHSCSVERLRYIFTALLPPLDGKVFLDVGSRLGAVLYGAYVLSTAARIIGVELNGDLCRLASDVLNQRHMLDRVDLVHADVCTQDKLISEADVVLVSNSFEYFGDSRMAIKCWRFLYDNLKPGSTLVLSPRAEETFELYGIGVTWSDWLSELPLHNAKAPGIDFPTMEESMAAYRVADPKPALPAPAHQ